MLLWVSGFTAVGMLLTGCPTLDLTPTTIDSQWRRATINLDKTSRLFGRLDRSRAQVSCRIARLWVLSHSPESVEYCLPALERESGWNLQGPEWSKWSGTSKTCFPPTDESLFQFVSTPKIGLGGKGVGEPEKWGVFPARRLLSCPPVKHPLLRIHPRLPRISTIHPRVPQK